MPPVQAIGSMSGGTGPRERHREFWARMDRCPTIEALQREFMHEAGRHGATQATVDAFMFSLRERGLDALAEPDTERRLGELSPAQIEQCMERIAERPTRYPGAGELLDALAEIVAGEP